MVKILIVIVCVVIGLMDYCCCAMAASADCRMERLSQTQAKGGVSNG